MMTNDEADAVCAACGIAEVDEIKLKKCAACYLVQYCSDECERDHRQQHEGACEKRAAELRDEILFKQPESSCFGDCTICFLPLPIDQTKSTFMGCCSKIICVGCGYAHALRNRLNCTCPFCRHPVPKSKAEAEIIFMKRVEKNDPVAMRQMGAKRYSEGEYSSAFEYFTKAAALGDVFAHCRLGDMYYHGKGVEKDEKKALYHWEEAAIGGHPIARDTIALTEMLNDRYERAVKHLIIGANLGSEESMKQLWMCFSMGYVSKDELSVTLRAHHAAVNATKSPQRKAAEEARERGEFLQV